MVPMIGFGFMDNTVLIYAGNAIDCTFGVTLGLSTLTAAACGQICSDVAGVSFSGVIDAAAARLGLPSPQFTEAQRETLAAKRIGLAGSLVGVVIGCSLGMTNLLLIDTEHAKELKLRAKDDPDNSDFTVSISNAEAPEATVITVEGPATRGLIASVVQTLAAEDCSIQGIQAKSVPMGQPKTRKFFVCVQDEQVEDDKLEALAKKVLSACKLPETAHKLLTQNQALHKENESLKQRCEKLSQALDNALISVQKRGQASVIN